MGNKSYLMENLIKHGNLGKNKFPGKSGVYKGAKLPHKLLNFITNIVRILKGNFKKTVIYLNGYLKFILNIVNDVIFSSFKQENNSIHGGKISEKANALGNSKDTEEYKKYREIYRISANFPLTSFEVIPN
jgi:hypothetical protein